MEAIKLIIKTCIILCSWFAFTATHGQEMTNMGVFTAGETSDIKVSGLSNEGTITGEGDWTIEGSVTNEGSADLDGNTVVYSPDLAIIGGSNSITFSNLEINVPDSVMLTTHIVVKDTLRLINGMLNINGYSISLDSTGLLTGEAETRRIYGDSGFIYLGNQHFVNEQSYINVGGLGIDVNFKGQTNPGAVDFIRHYTTTGLAERIVQITPEVNSALEADVILHYFDSEIEGDENLLELHESTSGSTGWAKIPATLNTSTNTMEFTDRTSLYYYGFTSTSASAPLPVELLSFSGEKLKQAVRLEWQTASEHNNDHFIIQRSADGVQFSEIGTMKGKGTAHHTSTYEYMDVSPLAGINYYRLLQKDSSGHGTYSDIISIHFGNDLSQAFSIYPNPISHDAQRLYLQLPAEDAAVITIFNSQGKVILHEASVATALVEIDMKRLNAAPGELLFINVTSSVSQFSCKLVVH
ncbi:MAG: hypothetical protein WD077_04280 [Bacteroidia bacterium]